ncbi:hypothetical protein [Pseudomonas syringae]|uniref:hypothetical protein n=1 Tax=Pseudomonas syringae TaxID=317 RepID=UPI0004743F8E|nr:hypothetical protein [Pseudomonas syringae]
MNVVGMHPGQAYQVQDPPLLVVNGDESPHQLGRFFTVLSANESGVNIYDGSYADGFASVFIETEIFESLHISKLDTGPSAVIAELIGALERSVFDSNERRNQLLDAGNTSDTAVEQSKLFFASFLAGQIKGLSAKGLINPDVAVQYASLITGVNLD